MASLQTFLSEPPGPAVEAIISSQFWDKDLSEQRENAYQPYFRYYATECRRLRLGISKDSWQSTMAATTHEHNLFIVAILRQEKSSKRPHIRNSIRQKFYNVDEQAINRSIDFALRTWFTINVREACFSLQTPRTPTIQWDDNSTLLEFVERIFPRPTTSSAVQFDHTFTAANINRLSGIDIEWTPCLADHLRFDKRKRLLRIYPLKQVLLDNLNLWSLSEVDSSESKTARLVDSCTCESLTK